MKISAKQLDVALGRLMTLCRGYGNGDTDVNVELTITQEDPGNGIMVDCLLLSATKLPHKNDEEEDTISTVTIEVYPASEQLEPRAKKVETFKVKKKY